MVHIYEIAPLRADTMPRKDKAIVMTPARQTPLEDRPTVNPAALVEGKMRFTHIYELILDNNTLLESELIELHRLILRKLNQNFFRS